MNVEQFFEENVGRWAPSTQRGYARYLRDLAEWVGESEVTTELLLEWLGQHDWKPATRKNAITALRSFFRWTLGEQSPAARLRFPKVPESSRRALLPGEALKMLAVPDTSTVKGKRDFAILALLMDTGLRNSELCNALIDKLQIRERALQIFIKGGRWEWCVFSEKTMRALEEWLNARDDVAVENRHIFVSVRGKNKGTKLGMSGLEYIIRTVARQAGIGHVCPHELRHSFAEFSLKAGASTRLLQIGGRWRDIQTVETYTRRLELEAFKDYLPMDFLMDAEETNPTVVASAKPKGSMKIAGSYLH